MFLFLLFYYFAKFAFNLGGIPFLDKNLNRAKVIIFLIVVFARGIPMLPIVCTFGDFYRFPQWTQEYIFYNQTKYNISVAIKNELEKKNNPAHFSSFPHKMNNLRNNSKFWTEMPRQRPFCTKVFPFRKKKRVFFLGNKEEKKSLTALHVIINLAATGIPSLGNEKERCFTF